MPTTLQIDLLINRILDLEAPICVGLDTSLDLIPDEILFKVIRDRGKSIKGATLSIEEYNKAIIDVIHDIVPCVKIQVAMYEKYGPEGMRSYKNTIKIAKDHGLIVIGDVKRGDVASTSINYAEAHLGKINILGVQQPVYDTEFITVNPYLGTDAVAPFIKECENHNRGIFVLVKTSNSSSKDFQDLLIHNPHRPEERSHLYEEVCRQVNAWGKSLIGTHGFSSVGAVVGATYPTQLKILRKEFPNLFFLVPGYGAQGAGVDSILPAFDHNSKGRRGAIINSSREILGAHKNNTYTGLSWKDAIRQSVIDMRDSLKKVLQ